MVAGIRYKKTRQVISARFFQLLMVKLSVYHHRHEQHQHIFLLKLLLCRQ